MSIKQLSQKTHRLLVIIIAILVSLFYLPQVDERDWLAWLISLAMVIPVFALALSLGAIFNGPSSVLDERESFIKLRYLQKSYWLQLIITAWVVIATVFIDSIDPHILIATLVITIVCVPALVTAWLEPDPIQDDSQAN